MWQNLLCYNVNVFQIKCYQFQFQHFFVLDLKYKIIFY